MTEGKNICLQFWQGNGNNYHNVLVIRKQTLVSVYSNTNYSNTGESKSSTEMKI